MKPPNELSLPLSDAISVEQKINNATRARTIV